jgi:Fe-S-cluster-containing hydrogenase component 2
MALSIKLKAGGIHMIFEMLVCGGCRTCEMACSFKHKGEFIPSVSSIKILDNDDGPGYRVELLEVAQGRNLACDGCRELEYPLCLDYCQKAEELEKILKTFQDERGAV